MNQQSHIAQPACGGFYRRRFNHGSAHLDALTYLRTGGRSLTCNCGYQRGYSVLEVIKVVKEVSGVDFPVKLSPRRPGDVSSVVAANGRIKSALGWKPKHDNLREIVE